MQRGSLRKRGKAWSYRLYTEGRDGELRRQEVGGFRTRDEAAAVLEDVLRRQRLGQLAELVYPSRVTLDALADEYLEQHQASAVTIDTLRVRLRYARSAFGAVDVRKITVRELRAWRARLPKKSARGVHQALRQTLSYAVDVGLLDDNPAARVPNPSVPREEVVPFRSWNELELLSHELDPRYAAVPLFVTATGLRPQEWIALERADVDQRESVVHIRRSASRGQLRSYGKTERSRRRVPLTQRAHDALELLPPRIDSRLLFPGPNGDVLDLHNWRTRFWVPALQSSGLERRRPYDLRHTFAMFAIAARAATLYELARFMGTSVAMIDRTYGHLFDDAESEFRTRFNAWNEQRAEEATTLEE